MLASLLSLAMAKIHVLISRREEESYEYKYIYHLNEADPRVGSQAGVADLGVTFLP